MIFITRILFFILLTAHLSALPLALQEKLDILFLQSNFRVLENKKSLKRAKFKVFYHGRDNNPYIAKHPKIPGYIFKMHTDSQQVEDGRRFVARIQGADAVREAIERHGAQDLFKVPHKWIYEIPPGAVSGHKTVILVAEDMEVLSDEKNSRKWKSAALTRDHADAIYVLLAELGLADTVYAFNLPFCKDGKMAFIDTECHHYWPVDFDHLTPYFSITMQIYWKYLIGEID